MVWKSWMRLCIGFSVIAIGCIFKLEAATLQRSHTADEDNVRKCGYDVSVQVTLPISQENSLSKKSHFLWVFQS